MNKIKTFFAVGLILMSSTLFSQTGKIRGTLIDSNNGEPVFGATVVIRSEKKFAKSDFDGKYELEIAPGTYEVEYQMYGYAPQKRKINVVAGKSESVNITFGSQTLQTVEVQDRALNNTEASLLALQKKSGTVSDGISQEAIKKSPDSSAGDVVRRVTGITLIGGKYIFVRGLGERYSNTMLNDILVSSPEPDKRVVPLDIFPAGVIKNIRVIKSFSPEESAEFSGGLVKIETQEFPDSFQLRFGVGVARNTNTTGKEFRTFEGGDFFGRPTSNQANPLAGLPEPISWQPGSRFGGLNPQLTNLAEVQFPQQWSGDSKSGPYDKNFNFSVGNSFKTTESGQRFGITYGLVHNVQYRTRDEKSARYIPGNAVNRDVRETSFLTPLQTQDSIVHNEDRLFGNNLNMTYEFTKGQQISWKNLYTVNSDKSVRLSDGSDPILNNASFKTQTNTFTSRQIFHTVLGGDHAVNFSDNFRPHKFEWNLGMSQAERQEPNLSSQYWIRPNPPQNFATPYRRAGNNPDGSRFYSNATDIARTISLKYDIPFNQWDGLKSNFKFGYYSMDRDKEFRFREYGVRSNVGAGTRQTDFWPVPGEIYYNPTEFLINRNQGGSFTGNQTFAERTGPGADFNAYNARQNLRAGFVQVDIPLVNKLRFVGGVRNEVSNQYVQTFNTAEAWNPFRTPSVGCSPANQTERLALINSGICQNDNWGIGNLRTNDRLPSMNLTYEITDKQNLRFGYNQTLTRPDFRELSPFFFTPFYGADRIAGNSLLKRSYIHNYDLRWEYYPTANDYMGVGVFQKNISDPIEFIALPAAGSINPRFSYLNAQSAVLQGIELDFRKEFDYFRFETNMFYIRSQVDVLPWRTRAFGRLGLLDRNDPAALYDPFNLSRPLQGQSPFVMNAKIEVFLNKAKSMNIGYYYNYFGDRIYAVGGAGLPDAYERGVGISDLVWTWQANDTYEFKFAAKNFTNQRFRIYQKNELLSAIRGEDVKELFFSYREGVTYTFSGTLKL